MEAQSFVDKFTEYMESHLSGNEADDVKDDPKAKARLKLSNMKPDLTFTRNSKWKAFLPQDCLDLKLEDKKHVFWCFLKSQYGESTRVHGVIAVMEQPLVSYLILSTMPLLSYQMNYPLLSY